MKTISQWAKAHKKIIGIAIVVIALFVIIIGGSKKSVGQEYVVAKRDVVDEALLSGTARIDVKADLGFAASGRLARVLVANNQPVQEGQLLAQLEIGDLLADRRIRVAEKSSTLSDLETAKERLENVKEEQEALVASAYRTMLSEDLAAVPSSTSYGVTAPEITGLYNGDDEGQYKIIVDTEMMGTMKHTVRTFELEKTDDVEILDDEATPLGTRGLYISFDDELSEYNGTVWYVSIPNKKGASYLANYNAYQEAKRRMDLEIRQAEGDYNKALAKESGGVSVTDAEISKIDAEIRKNSIYAPFAGTVTNIDIEEGENASTGERVLSVLGEGKLEIVLEVPELDIPKLVPESPIEVTIDAIPGETFAGVLKTINSRETEVDGVPVYEAFVEIEADPRIKNGMSAYGHIVLAEKKDVIAVPFYMLTEENGAYYVQVMNEDNKISERLVEIGLKGSDNYIEITSGLALGEIVIGTDPSAAK